MAVRDLSYRIIWKQITTGLGCVIAGGLAVRDLSYRIIWKQITTITHQRGNHHTLCET